MTVQELLDVLAGCDPTDIVVFPGQKQFALVEHIAKLRATQIGEGTFVACTGPDEDEHDDPDVNYNAVVLS